MARNTFTDAEIVEALRLIETYKTAAAASRATGIPPSTLKERRDQAEPRGLTLTSTVLTEADKLKEQVRSLTQENKRLLRDNETEDAIRSRIFQFAQRPPAPAYWPDLTRKPNEAAEVPVLFISDIHHGEVVNKIEMAGANEFNAEISRQRIRACIQTAVSLLRNNVGRATKDFPGIVLCLGGDMVTGTIHEELATTNDRTTMQSVHDLTDEFITAISILRKEFKRVFIPCVVGNHGRGTHRYQFKQKVWTSYEWLLYTALEREFRNDSGVVFLIPGEADAYFRVNGWKFLLTHGDTLGVKGGDGIIGAIGPIMRGTVKLGTSERQIGRDFDYLMMGHWHYPLYLPRTIVNGCIKGYDEYARLGLRVPYAPASQMLFLVHPEFGITMRREIILQGEQIARDIHPDDWVSIFKGA